MAKIEGTNVKPSGQRVEVSQTSNTGTPPQIIPNIAKGGPYYKQPGASGGKKK